METVESSVVDAMLVFFSFSIKGKSPQWFRSWGIVQFHLKHFGVIRRCTGCSIFTDYGCQFLETFGWGHPQNC